MPNDHTMRNDDTGTTAESLIAKGRRQKQLNESEVLALFDDPDSDEAQALLDRLEEMGVEIISDSHDDAAFASDLDDADDGDLDLNGFDNGDHGLDFARIEAGALADDPVRMYLKEIGQVQLLDPDRETWLSSQIAACSLLDTVTQRLTAALSDGETPEPVDVLAAIYGHLLDHWRETLDRVAQFGVEPPLVDLLDQRDSEPAPQLERPGAVLRAALPGTGRLGSR